MLKCKADYTMTFRELSEISVEDLQLVNYPKVKKLKKDIVYFEFLC